MTGQACEHGLRACRLEVQPCGMNRRLQPGQTKSGELERMRRHAQQRSEQVRSHGLPGRCDRTGKPAPCAAVLTQAVCRFFNGVVKRDSITTLKRMCQWKVGLDPTQSVFLQRQRLKKGRGNRHGVNGRPNVVAKAGQRCLFRAYAAAGHRFRLIDRHAGTGTRQRNRRAKSVRSASHHNGSLHLHFRCAPCADAPAGPANEQAALA